MGVGEPVLISTELALWKRKGSNAPSPRTTITTAVSLMVFWSCSSMGPARSYGVAHNNHSPLCGSFTLRDLGTTQAEMNFVFRGRSAMFAAPVRPAR